MSGAPSDADAWRPLETADGSFTLCHPVHGEACHSTSGAWSEARARYVEACRLPERFARGDDGLRVLDVGTGPGFNLAALLAAAEARGVGVRATTLELEPAVVRRALALGAAALAPAADARPWLERTLAALGEALEAPGRAVPFGARGTLALRLGDARRTLPALADDARFDAVFLDAFSPAVAPELWQPEFLRALAGRLAPGGWLSTYSAAARVRAGLAAAGLRVGAGPRFGAKAEGTLAAPDADPGGLEPRARRRLARRAAELCARLGWPEPRGAAGEAPRAAGRGFPAGSPSGEGLD